MIIYFLYSERQILSSPVCFHPFTALFQVMYPDALQSRWYLKMNQRKEAMHFLQEHGHLDGAMLIGL